MTTPDPRAPSPLRDLELAVARGDVVDQAVELLKVPPGRERVARWQAFEDATRRYAELAGVDLEDTDGR